jgi:iron complex outermembrane receptor protein
MKKIYLIFVFLLTSAQFLLAQKATIKGTIINGQTKETLPGVNVIYSGNKGTVTDYNGNYQIITDAGKIKVQFKYIGFGTVEKEFDLKSGQTVTFNVEMKEESVVIEGIVVSAGKYEQKLSDVTVSMSILKPDQILNQNVNMVDQAVNKLPGVDVYDGQPSIRSGSGYSYGAGSRVLIMVDDMPMLAPDAGDAKWNFLPIENLSQVEVIKGASSALYGSSALNGVINLRTAYPGVKPQTKIIIDNGIYLSPRREQLVWWDDTKPDFYNAISTQLSNPLHNLGVKNPGFGSITFLHSRKIGQLDLVVGGNAYADQGFRERNGENHARINANLRYRFKKVDGFSVGLNTNYMYAKKTDFFLWQNADSGAYRQNPSAISENNGYRFNIDPYITYFNKKGDRYSLKVRYYRQTNQFKDDSAKNNNADILYGDFQYQHNYRMKHFVTAGISGSYSQSQAPLFGSHFGINISAYGQLDAKLAERVSFSVGLRAEYFRIDTAQSESTYSIKINGKNHTLPFMPVLRVGVNYNPSKYTFIRASFGQGYRFPSMAEKFVSTSVGGLNIFPNKLLKPETGWSAEIGVKQGIKIGKWKGYLDVAEFWTEYHDMIEFTFGIYKPDSVLIPSMKDVGFKSLNVGNARINGLDVTLTGEGNIGKVITTFILGYTFNNPVNMDYNPETDTTEWDIQNKYLKYRNMHSVKLDIEAKIKRWTIGFGMIYNSNMINIDKAFEKELVDGMPSSQLLPGLKEYREKHDKGYCVFTLRGLFEITQTQKIGLFINNVFNTEYMTRPGYVEAPINVAVQYSLSL